MTDTRKPSQTAIGKALRLTKGRISQLKRAGMPTSSVEAAREWIAARNEEIGKGNLAPVSLNDARLRKVLLECALLQLELERKRKPGDDVPVSVLKTGIEQFVAFASVFARATAGQAAAQVQGRDVFEATRVLEDYADAGTHAGFSAWLVNCPEPMRTIFCDELAKGDHRHDRGGELRKTCDHNALCVARALLAEEQL